MSRPTHIFFDVNETLTDFSALVPVFAELGLTEDDLAHWFAAVLRDGFALTTTDAEASFATIGSHYLAELSNRRSLPTPDVDTRDAVVAQLATLPAHDDVASAVRDLASERYALCTLSNGSTAAAAHLCEALNIRQHFAHLLSVSDAGIWKPARAAYEFGMSAAGSAAEASVLVAVHPWDIHGAHQAGMRTIWVNRAGSRYPHYFSSPTAQVTALTEITETLTDWS